MVLESPHKSEYSGKTPIGPAQGKTGENFKRQFFDRFDGASSGAGFLEGMLGARPIIIMNAIEHQCSMGKLSEPEDKRARDLVFRKLWFHHGGSQSFKLRLDALKLDIDDVLVNTCTKGVNKDAKERSWGKPRLLKECVQASIDDFCMTSGLYELRRFQLTHPSSWLGSSQTQ